MFGSGRDLQKFPLCNKQMPIPFTLKSLNSVQVNPTQAPVIVSEPTKPLEPEPEPEPPKEPTEKLAALLEQSWAPPKKKSK